jgi:hypothetical protein
MTAFTPGRRVVVLASTYGQYDGMTGTVTTTPPELAGAAGDTPTCTWVRLDGQDPRTPAIGFDEADGCELAAVRASRVASYRRRMVEAGSMFPAARTEAEAAGSLLRVRDVMAGILTWDSNGQHPHDDLLAAWLILGLITEEQATATATARQVAQDNWMAAYRASPPQRSAEELAEMRAAFGPGTEVVDVITGQRIRT